MKLTGADAVAAGRCGEVAAGVLAAGVLAAGVAFAGGEVRSVGAAVTGAALSVGAATTTVGATGIGAGSGLFELPLVQANADITSKMREGDRRIEKVLSATTGSGKRL